MIHSREGRFALAEPIYRDTARRHEQALGLGHPTTNRSYRNLTSALVGQGKIEEARTAGLKVLASHRARRAGGDEGATFLNDFAWHLVTILPEDLRDPEAALPMAERAIELTGREWDSAVSTLARVHFELGNYERAIELQLEVLASPGIEAFQLAERYLIEYLEAAGDLERVEVELRRHLERRRERRGEEAPIIAYSHRNLGLNLAKRGFPERALAEYQRAADHFDQTLPPDHFDRIRAHSELGEALTELGRFAEAEARLLPAAEALRGRVGWRDHTSKVRAQGRVAELYLAWGRPERATEWEARARAEAAPPEPRVASEGAG